MYVWFLGFCLIMHKETTITVKGLPRSKCRISITLVVL
jgi:hypothetical protein